jgi:hypothetical protein
MRDKDRQGGAHQQRRNEDQQEVDRCQHHQRQIRDQVADLIKHRERDHTERGGQQFDHAQKQQRPDISPLRNPSADEASQSQAQHERGDDDRHRLGVDAKDSEQAALPGQLIDQRRKTGKEEQHAEQANPAGKPGRRRGYRRYFEAGHRQISG